MTDHAMTDQTMTEQAMTEQAMTVQAASRPKHVVDTHRHPIGPKLRAKMVERGLFDNTKPLPQTNASDIVFYRDFVDLDYSMGPQREGGVTRAIASSGGEIEWVAEKLLGSSPAEAARFVNEESVEIRERYPDDFALMANAHALDATTRADVERMLGRHGAKAIAVATSYGAGAERTFLDAPEAEWLWDYAQANDLLVHVHPPMASIGAESLMRYRLVEAIGRPFDTTVTAARMIHAGVFDRYPRLKVLFVHMGGDLPAVLGRLDFNWRLNYHGVANPPADKVDKNRRAPSEYFRTNIYVDTMGFSAIGLRAAIATCGIDRVLFGTDYGPVPISPREHIEVVEQAVPEPTDREKVFWRNSVELFKLDVAD